MTTGDPGVGRGGPRAWRCFGVPAQPHSRGHFANACFHIRVGLRRLLHAIEPFRELPSLLHRAVTDKKCPVNCGSPSDATQRYLMC